MGVSTKPSTPSGRFTKGPRPCSHASVGNRRHLHTFAVVLNLILAVIHDEEGFHAERIFA
jgi:hypothetical protein